MTLPLVALSDNNQTETKETSHHGNFLANKVNIIFRSLRAETTLGSSVFLQSHLFDGDGLSASKQYGPEKFVVATLFKR